MFSTFVYDLNELTEKNKVYFIKTVNKKQQVSSSIALNSKMILELHCDKRLAATSARLMLRDDASDFISYITPYKTVTSFTENVFYFQLNSNDICKDKNDGLFFYRFEINSMYGYLYSVRKSKFSPEDLEFNIYHSPLDLSYDSAYKDETLFPLTVFDSDKAQSSSICGAIIYHIFVDRFYKKNKVPLRDDSVFESDWYNGIPEFAPIPGGDIPNNTHFGGNFYGIIDKLSYIKSLGADYIYLSPVFKAYSNHKYDTGDYEKIDENFGGEKAFKALIKKSNGIGLKIILDGVFNHTGDDSRYFNRYQKYESCGAYNSKDSKYYSWFDFKNHPDDYECWWGVKCLPTIKKYCPDFWEYIAGENGIISKYAKMGIKGFRLDVVDELDQCFLTKISQTLRDNDPDNCLIGEVWEDASTKVAYGTRKNYFSTGNLDGVINYPFRNAIIDFLLNEDAFSFANALSFIIENYPVHQLMSSMLVLSTHDTERIVTKLGEPNIASLSPLEQSSFKLSPDKITLAKRLQKLASVLQFTLPGAPTIYYGDETSMEGGKDPFNRLCYPWGQEDTEMISHYQRIAFLHQKISALRYGNFNIVHIDRGLIAFERVHKKSKCLVVVNASNQERFFPDLSGMDLLNNEESSPIIKPLQALIIKK